MRGILEKAGRGDDYLEIGLDGAWQWNPLDDPLLDTYSLAYGVASLINQLFGKSREPFWQQAYTNLVRWIIELYRLLPGGWVTLQDVYRCTIDAELFGREDRRGPRAGRPPLPGAGRHRDQGSRRSQGTPRGLGLGAGGRHREGHLPARSRVERSAQAELEIPFETEERARAERGASSGSRSRPSSGGT